MNLEINNEKPQIHKPHLNFKKGEFWRHIPAYQDVDDKLFLDHKWQMKMTITSVKKLLDTLKEIVSEEFYNDVKQGFQESPMAVRITPYVMALIDWNNPYNDPLRRQFLPLASQRLPDHPELHLDTLHEQDDSPVHGLTHRYPDKVLFLALDICPVYCRYCTRSYAIGSDTEEVHKVKMQQDMKRYEQMFEYLKAHPEVEDVVLSGGDAFMLRPERLDFLLKNLLAIPNILRIRVATKGPAILPMKILTDSAWTDTLIQYVELGRKQGKEVCLHTHFSHPDEVTDISQKAMQVLFEAGVTVRNQSVLQRGVNDSAETMILLNRRISALHVHPYYVYVHDLVKGVEDLRTTVQEAIDIEKMIRGSTAGFNTPTFVVDAPGGGGKRDVHSYEYYDRETGISVYTAPSVKPGQYFMYFDPLQSLSKDIQLKWLNPTKAQEMKLDALSNAKLQYK